MKQYFPLLLLPTNKDSKFWLTKSGKLLSSMYPATNKKYGKNQHLYVVSDEQIKAGDWRIHPEGMYMVGDIPQNVGFKPRLTTSDEIPDMPEEIFNIHGWKKIIASSDKSLGLHWIDDLFIDYYLKAYNMGKPITSIELEMENWRADGEGGRAFKTQIPRIKIKPNGIINIPVQTIEEAAINYMGFPMEQFTRGEESEKYEAFISGANWQKSQPDIFTKDELMDWYKHVKTHTVDEAFLYILNKRAKK